MQFVPVICRHFPPTTTAKSFGLWRVIGLTCLLYWPEYLAMWSSTGGLAEEPFAYLGWVQNTIYHCTVRLLSNHEYGSCEYDVYIDLWTVENSNFSSLQTEYCWIYFPFGKRAGNLFWSLGFDTDAAARCTAKATPPEFSIASRYEDLLHSVVWTFCCGLDGWIEFRLRKSPPCC